MSDFMPLNELEVALEKVRSGRMSMPDFLGIFVNFDLAVPSGGEVMPDGSGFEPLLFDKKRVKIVACFTAKERVGGFAKLAPYCLVLKGKAFLRRIPAGYGLVINPGQSVGFDVSPEGLVKIIREFGE